MGAMIACLVRDLTVTSGSFAQVLEMTGSAGGLFHIVGTGVPRQVALADAIR